MLSGSDLSLPISQLSELANAVEKNDLEKVKKIIGKHPSLVNTKYNDRSILVIALDQKFKQVDDIYKLCANYEMIKFLVQNNADLNDARQYANTHNNRHVLKRIDKVEKKTKHFSNPPPVLNQYQNNVHSGSEALPVASKDNILSNLFKRKSKP